MSTEDKRTGTGQGPGRPKKTNKITPIRFPYEESDDPVIDEFILQGLREEADEAERRVNSDPELSKVTAPDDQYDRIVAHLKEMGVWREDEDETDPSEENNKERVRTADAAMAEEEDGAAWEKEAEETVLTEEEDGVAGEKAPDGVPLAESEVGKTQKSWDNDAIRAKEENARSRKKDEDAGTPRAAETESAAMLNTMEAAEAAEAAEPAEPEDAELEKLYQMLPEEDRRVIERAHRKQRRRQERKTTRPRLIRKVLRRSGIVAAVFVVIFGVSMNVEASRRLILRMWDAVTESFVARTVTNNVEEEKAIQSVSLEEKMVMQKIEEATGIPGVDFVYWPYGMEFLRYEIFSDQTEAKVFYSYEDAIVELYMKNTDLESTSYYTTDESMVLRETIEGWYETKIEIWVVNPEREDESYLAEFEYEGCRYIISGRLPIEELEELVKNMAFLS